MANLTLSDNGGKLAQNHAQYIEACKGNNITALSIVGEVNSEGGMLIHLTSTDLSLSDKVASIIILADILKIPSQQLLHVFVQRANAGL